MVCQAPAAPWIHILDRHIPSLKIKEALEDVATRLHHRWSPSCGYIEMTNLGITAAFISEVAAEHGLSTAEKREFNELRQNAPPQALYFTLFLARICGLTNPALQTYLQRRETHPTEGGSWKTRKHTKIADFGPISVIFMCSAGLLNTSYSLQIMYSDF